MKRLLSILLLLGLTQPGWSQFKNSQTNNLPYASTLSSNDVFVIGVPGVTNKNLRAGQLFDFLGTSGILLPVGSLSGVYTNPVALLNSLNAWNGNQIQANSITLGGEERTNWPSGGGGSSPTNAHLIATVSSEGIANGKSSATNAGLMFGPDTPGTLTCGIQEAIDSLYRGADLLGPGGGKVQLGAGNFPTYATIHTSFDRKPFAFTLEGAGAAASGICYAGSTNADVLRVGLPGGWNETTFKMHDLYLASQVNSTNYLLKLDGRATNDDFQTYGGVAWATIEDCVFGWWFGMTNATDSGTVLRFPSPGFSDNHYHNLIAIGADCDFSGPFWVQRCGFQNVNGIYFQNDHGEISRNWFSYCGATYYASNHTEWPTNSPFYLGAAIYLIGTAGAGNETWTFKNNDFIGCRLAYYVDTGVAHPVTYEDNIEGGVDYVATTGHRVIAVNPTPLSGGNRDVFDSNWIVTQKTNFVTWRTLQDTTNAVSVFDMRNRLITGPGYTMNGSGVTNVLPGHINWSGLSTAAFTNNISARIPVYTNAGITYYLTLSTNVP